MITREERLSIEPPCSPGILEIRDRIVFFDIETTGLSVSKAGMYLIGTVTFEEGSWILRQFFAENVYDEPELLNSFFAVLRKKKKLGRVFLISYNGDGFDIPFIRNCISQYHLNYSFADTVSIDLLKKMRPYRKLAGICDCRLKTVEALCGIHREDRYNGGELIYVYEEYLRLSRVYPGSLDDNDLNRKLKQKLLETLLLHNAEDIADMPMILNVLGYEKLFAGEFTVTESRLDEAYGVWDIRAELSCPLPKELYHEDESAVLSVSGEDPLLLNLAVTPVKGEMKYFFADYKEYYYLPAEDYAIHKSVGEYVDRKARRQATARTCYQKHSGLFVPQREAVFPPMFYRDYKTLPSYGDLSKYFDRNNKTVDIDITKRYIMDVLSQIK